MSNGSHDIYLSILQIIRDYGSIDKAVSELKPIIDKAKEEEKKH